MSYSFENLACSDDTRGLITHAFLTVYGRAPNEDEREDILSDVHLRLVQHGDFAAKGFAIRWLKLCVRSCVSAWGRNEQGENYGNRVDLLDDEEYGAGINPSQNTLESKGAMLELLELAVRDIGPALRPMAEYIRDEFVEGEGINTAGFDAAKRDHLSRYRKWLKERAPAMGLGEYLPKEKK